MQYLYSQTGKQWDTSDHCNLDPDVPDDVDDASLVTEDPLDSVFDDERFEEDPTVSVLSPKLAPDSQIEEEKKQQYTLDTMGTF